MKVLLSAYACEPGRGSEPGVGWRWAHEIANRGHDVWVLTRANNQSAIEAQGMTSLSERGLHFLYYDLPPWAKRWKKGSRGVYLYYLLWQWGAYNVAKAAHVENGFDVVHHITFGSMRLPSFLGKLGVPFVFGPAGGGERAPWALRKGYSFKGHLYDFARDVSNLLLRVDPFTRRTFRFASQIFVTSEQSKQCLPRKYREKATMAMAIGAEDKEISAKPLCPTKDGCTFLFVGRLLGWKGVSLLLSAFAIVLKQMPNAQLLIRGDGGEMERWKNTCEQARIGHAVQWIPRLDEDALTKLYLDSDVMVFPSLHDSGGQVVLEAMAQGIPVVCLALGGPGHVCNHTCGRTIDVENASAAEVAERMSSAMLELARNDELRADLSQGAVKRARVFSWHAVVENVYARFE